MGAKIAIRRIRESRALQLGNRYRGALFLSRYRDYLQTGRHRKDDESYLLSAFLRSGGRLLDRASAMSAKDRGPIDLSWAPDTLGYGADRDLVISAVNALRDSGFTVLPLAAAPEITLALQSDFDGALCRTYSDDPALNDQVGIVPGDGQQRAEKYSVIPELTLKSATFRSLILDRTLLSIAQEYLSVPPVIDNASIWWSFPSVRGASSEAAQRFHFDLERVKWLKVFIHLEDVAASNGPHVFVPGSHRTGAIPSNLLARGYARLDDESVERAFPGIEWFHAIGPRGTILIKDTRGLHKGTEVANGTRVLAQVQYSQSLFGTPSPLGGKTREGLSSLMTLMPKGARSMMLPGRQQLQG